MSFSVDFKELKNYDKKIEKLNHDFNKFLRKFLTEMAERVLAEVKPRTPVDKGSLRDSWTLGDIHGSSENISIDILNGMEYASFVELGHRGVFVPSLGVTLWTDRRWTEGRFMLNISINLVSKQIPERYEVVFAAFCKQHGVS